MRTDLLPNTFEGCLDRLVEEMGEVLQAIGKLRRYGAHPVDHKTGIKYDNVQHLALELGDLEHAMICIDEQEWPK